MHHKTISGAFTSVQGTTDVPAPIFESSPFFFFFFFFRIYALFFIDRQISPMCGIFSCRYNNSSVHPHLWGVKSGTRLESWQKGGGTLRDSAPPMMQRRFPSHLAPLVPKPYSAHSTQFLSSHRRASFCVKVQPQCQLLH